MKPKQKQNRPIVPLQWGNPPPSPNIAQSAGAVEYTNCTSAEE